MELLRQEYWSGLPFPNLGDLPKPGIKPSTLVSPALASGFFNTPQPGKPEYQSKLVSIIAVVVPLLCHVQLFATPWTAACQASLLFNCSFLFSRSLLKLMSIELVMSSNHLILCRPLLLLPSIFPASGSFPMSQFFASGGQNIRVSASASVQYCKAQYFF